MSKISLKHSGGNVVSLNSPTSAPTSADVAFKLPNADGTNGQALVTDASGNLSFAGTGKILQVVSTTKTDTFSESVATGSLSADVITVNITPSNASNKILLTAFMSIGLSNDNEINWVFYKAGSILAGAISDANGSNRRRRTAGGDVRSASQHNTTGGQYLDTAGGTSQITYSVRLGHANNGAVTVYLNKPHSSGDYTYDYNTISTLTAMEIAA
jgi:hypothetical protein